MNQEKERGLSQGQIDAQTKSKLSKPEYEPPAMITYTEEELLEELGPIQACSGFSSSVIC